MLLTPSALKYLCMCMYVVSDSDVVSLAAADHDDDDDEDEVTPETDILSHCLCAQRSRFCSEKPFLSNRT
jgi:hypothetical protein